MKEAKLVDKIDDKFYVIAYDRNEAEIAVANHLEKHIREEEQKQQRSLETFVKYLRFDETVGNHIVIGYYQ